MNAFTLFLAGFELKISIGFIIECKWIFWPPGRLRCGWQGDPLCVKVCVAVHVCCFLVYKRGSVPIRESFFLTLFPAEWYPVVFAVLAKHSPQQIKLSPPLPLPSGLWSKLIHFDADKCQDIQACNSGAEISPWASERMRDLSSSVSNYKVLHFYCGSKDCLARLYCLRFYMCWLKPLDHFKVSCYIWLILSVRLLGKNSR